MGKNGTIEMKRETSEKNHEEWKPFEVLNYCTNETLFSQAVAEDSKTNITLEKEILATSLAIGDVISILTAKLKTTRMERKVLQPPS